VRGVHIDLEVDQCDQGGHKGPSYLVLVWDLGKGFKAKGARHSSYLAYRAYPAHVGIGFPSI
jgi:hypothetical protein